MQCQSCRRDSYAWCRPSESAGIQSTNEILLEHFSLKTKNKHVSVKTNRRNRMEYAVAKHHLKGHSSLKSVGKYSAI